MLANHACQQVSRSASALAHGHVSTSAEAACALGSLYMLCYLSGAAEKQRSAHNMPRCTALEHIHCELRGITWMHIVAR